MGSGSKRSRGVRCGSRRAGWSQPSSCGSELRQDALCRSDLKQLGSSGRCRWSRFVLPVVSFEGREQEADGEGKNRLQIIRIFRQILSEEERLERRGWCCVASEKPELGPVWLSATHPMINTTLSLPTLWEVGLGKEGPKASVLDLQAFLGCDCSTLSIPTGGLSEQRWVCALLKIHDAHVLPLFQCNSWHGGRLPFLSAPAKGGQGQASITR